MHEDDSEDSDGKKLTEEQKRQKEKEEIEGKLKKRLISTSIANTDYIKNVIEAYVYGNEEAKAQLYREPKKIKTPCKH